MKTQEEIKKEIKALKIVRPKVKPYSIFGDDNLAQLDAEINVLENYLDEDEINDKYDHAGASEEILNAAFHARDWIDGEVDPDGNESLAEDWPLKEGEKSNDS